MLTTKEQDQFLILRRVALALRRIVNRPLHRSEVRQWGLVCVYLAEILLELTLGPISPVATNEFLRESSPFPRAGHIYIYPIAQLYAPPGINALPPLRGLSYCAWFLSRKYAPPTLTRPYIYIYIYIYIRVCFLDPPHARYRCMHLYLRVSFYSSIMSNNRYC